MQVQFAPQDIKFPSEGITVERRIVAIMAADIVGYSRMMEADETGTLARQKRIQADVVDPILAASHGRIVKKMGDGILVEFASPVEAVQCGIALQSALAAEARTVPSEQQQIMRIGINLGDVILEDGDLFGDGVNIAARLEQLAPPGGLCISGTVFDHLKSNVDAQIVEMGATTVKNIAQPVRTYQVLVNGTTRARSTSPKSGWLRRLLWPVALTAVLAIALVVGLIAAGPPDQLAGETDELSIVVLPFENVSGDPAQDYFAIGISEDINTDLSKVSGLSVRPPSAAHKFGEDNVTAAWIGPALGVDYVLEGSLRRVGDQIRLNVRLTEVASEEQIWAERYDRQIDDVFSIQDEIAEQVVAELPASLARTARSYTPNIEAYDSYIRSRAQRIPPTPANLAAAKQSAERAITLDPQFAGGHAGLAFVTLLEAEAQTDATARATLNAQALGIAQEAIRLDRDFGPAWGSLAEAHFRAGDVEAALEASRRAVALSPTDSLMRGQLGRYMSYAGDPVKGMTHIRTALRMSPDSLPLLYFQGVSLLAQGEFKQAAETLADHRNRLNDRILPAPTSIYIAALVEAKRSEDAAREVEKLRSAFPGYDLEQALAYHRFSDDGTAQRFQSALTWAGLS